MSEKKDLLYKMAHDSMFFKVSMPYGQHYSLMLNLTVFFGGGISVH